MLVSLCLSPQQPCMCTGCSRQLCEQQHACVVVSWKGAAFLGGGSKPDMRLRRVSVLALLLSTACVCCRLTVK